MNKKYITPSVKVINIAAEEILAGSDPQFGNGTAPSGQGKRGRNVFFDDDDYED